MASTRKVKPWFIFNYSIAKNYEVLKAEGIKKLIKDDNSFTKLI